MASSTPQSTATTIRNLGFIPPVIPQFRSVPNHAEKEHTMITMLAAVACIVAASALTAVATASPTGSEQATHFAGLPPVGVKASTPTTGRLVIGLRPTATTEWNVYADGRVIWQKWTPAGDATVVPKGASKPDTGYSSSGSPCRGCSYFGRSSLR